MEFVCLLLQSVHRSIKRQPLHLQSDDETDDSLQQDPLASGHGTPQTRPTPTPRPRESAEKQPHQPTGHAADVNNNDGGLRTMENPKRTRKLIQEEIHFTRSAGRNLRKILPSDPSDSSNGDDGNRAHD